MAAAKKRSADKVQLTRNLILGFLGLLVLGFVTTTFYFGSGLSQNSGPQAGTDYEVIDGVELTQPARSLIYWFRSS